MLYVCILCVYICFFFFKQKTAYEMRISDWSSDVCSSDLFAPDCILRPSLPHWQNRAQYWWLLDVSRGFEDVAERCSDQIDHGDEGMGVRSEERRVGKEWVSTFRSRWSRNH